MNVRTRPLLDKEAEEAQRAAYAPLLNLIRADLAAILEVLAVIRRNQQAACEDRSRLRDALHTSRAQHDPESCLDLDDVADILSVSRRTVDTLIADGELPSIKIRRCRRVPRRALEAYIAARAEEVQR